jgi:hypothetical protein
MADPIVHTVRATREGLLGQRTASGYVIDRAMPYVALPANALYRFVRVTNPSNGKSCIAIVLEKGPWNIDDNAYVFGSARPQAESGVDTRGRLTNRSGIDLGERVWHALGMTNNGPLSWEFLDEEPPNA